MSEEALLQLQTCQKCEVNPATEKQSNLHAKKTYCAPCKIKVSRDRLKVSLPSIPRQYRQRAAESKKHNQRIINKWQSK